MTTIWTTPGSQARARASAHNERRPRAPRATPSSSSALDWIGRQSGKWFVWVHVYDPHVTYDPPAEWKTRFPADPYLGEVSWTDSALGVLFDRLVRAVAPHARHRHGRSRRGPRRPRRADARRVRLRVGAAGAADRERDRSGAARAQRERGVTIESPARHVDLLPTMLEAAGAAADGTLPGASLARAIAGRRRRPAVVLRGDDADARPAAGRRCAACSSAARSSSTCRSPSCTTFARIRPEQRNLFATRTDRAPVLVNVLKTFNVAPPGRPQKETPETLERLRSLGYIGGGVAAVREAYTDADDPKRLIELEQTMTRAADAFRQGRPDEAIGMYKSVIAKRADTEDAYRKLALVYWRGGPSALTRSRRSKTALRNGVTQSEVRIKLGQYLAESGQPDKAIALLAGETGDDPDALIALGNAYQLAGQPAAAIRTFKRLLEIDPKNGLAWENIGTSQLQTGDVAAAESVAAARHRARQEPRRRLHRARRRARGNEPQRARRSTRGRAPSPSTPASSTRSTTSRSTSPPPAGATRRAYMGRGSSPRRHRRCRRMWRR